MTITAIYAHLNRLPNCRIILRFPASIFENFYAILISYKNLSDILK